MTAKKSQPLPVRGIMLDPARLTERHEFYFELLEMMAGWGLNTLWWHFADDEGFMLKLETHPELASPYAFSRAEMKRLLARAGELGIDVVPEVESLGHARFITSLPQYAELADGTMHGFNAICPSHRRTVPLLAEIIREVAEVFPSPHFHAGLDEVDLGECPRCRRRGRRRPPWWIYAEHTKAIHEIVTGAGKEMIIWADHVEKSPAMLKVLPRDIIMAHWHYRQPRPEAVRRSLSAGFRVIGCPALCHSGDMIMPNAANLENMDAMTALFPRLRPGGRVLGVVNTCWTLWRGLRDAYLPAMAYTGDMLRRRRPLDRRAFFRRFVRDFFGVKDASAARAVGDLHDAMIGRAEVAAALFDSLADMHAALKLAEQEDLDERRRRLEAALAALKKWVGRIKTHRDEFLALVLSGETAALCCRRAGQLASAFAEYARAEALHGAPGPDEQVARHLAGSVRILERMHADLRKLTSAVAAEWDRTRYADDAKKWFRPPSRRCSDALLVRLEQAQAFGASLVRDFARGVAAYRRTGRFPGGL